jgi:hypothetical protein
MVMITVPVTLPFVDLHRLVGIESEPARLSQRCLLRRRGYACHQSSGIHRAALSAAKD